MARTRPMALPSNAPRCGPISQEKPTMSSSPSVCTTMAAAPGPVISSATLPSRMRKNAPDGVPSRKRKAPSGKATFDAQPTSRDRYSWARPAKNLWLRSSGSRVCGNGGDLLGDVDADRAPRDAPAAAHAAGRAELVEPGGELVRHPLPVARPGGRSHRPAVQVGVVHREAGIPGPVPLRILPSQAGDVLYAEAEARWADHRAVSVAQAPRRHVVPARVIVVVVKQVAQVQFWHRALHGGGRRIGDCLRRG